MRMRKLIGYAAVLAFALMFAGCSTQTASPAQNASSQVCEKLIEVRAEQAKAHAETAQAESNPSVTPAEIQSLQQMVSGLDATVTQVEQQVAAKGIVCP